ncbi:MAG: hypothetical protein QOG84_283 [Sphingomonadales bacterium]|jgi:uncharacterized protein|nr:hypothetical protein [Sphingomonadales bacterium]
MDREPRPEGPVVHGFAGAGFAVDGRVYRSLLLTPESADEWTSPALTLESLEPLLRLSPPPEFLLLGTGPSLALPPRPLVRVLETRGIGVEAMDSRAAARTWGLLRGEGRWIAAALMPL